MNISYCSAFSKKIGFIKPRWPGGGRFCANFGGGLKKNGIDNSKDDYLGVNYIVLALIWVVKHISTICGSKVMEFWKKFGIFGKSGQNRGKIAIKSGKSDFFGIFQLIPSNLMVFYNFPSFFVLSMIFDDFRGGGDDHFVTPCIIIWLPLT